MSRLEEAMREVLRITDRKHVAWDKAYALLASGSVIEAKALTVVKAWERLGSCIDEMGPQYCGEYEDALDDAIVALRAALEQEAASGKC